MTVKASHVSFIQDHAPGITLRELADGSESGLGYSHAASVEVRRVTPRWHNAQPLESSWTNQGQVGSINALANATFVLEISASVTAGGARTVITSMPLISVGAFKIGIDSNQLSPNDNYLHVGVNITGDAPHSINWSAQIAPDPTNPR